MMRGTSGDNNQYPIQEAPEQVADANIVTNWERQVTDDNSSVRSSLLLSPATVLSPPMSLFELLFDDFGTIEAHPYQPSTVTSILSSRLMSPLYTMVASRRSSSIVHLADNNIDRFPFANGVIVNNCNRTREPLDLNKVIEEVLQIVLSEE
jgi:hypothetical protein